MNLNMYGTYVLIIVLKLFSVNIHIVSLVCG